MALARLFPRMGKSFDMTLMRQLGVVFGGGRLLLQQLKEESREIRGAVRRRWRGVLVEVASSW